MKLRNLHAGTTANHEKAYYGTVSKRDPIFTPVVHFSFRVEFLNKTSYKILCNFQIDQTE